MQVTKIQSYERYKDIEFVTSRIRGPFLKTSENSRARETNISRSSRVIQLISELCTIKSFENALYFIRAVIRSCLQ